MSVILRIGANAPFTYVQGADGIHPNFTEDASNAFVFADAAAATAFAVGKVLFGAVQVTVSGLKDKGHKGIS